MMISRTVLGVVFFCASIPSLAFAQGTYVVDASGCIVGRPCAHGVPLPPPKQGVYAVDADGCVIGQPCPWRGLQHTTTPPTDRRSGKFELDERRIPRGSRDVDWFNDDTGSLWDRRLAPPFASTPTAAFRFGTTQPLNFVFEPSERELDSSTREILSGRQPGALVMAARAAARQRRLKLQDENERNACMIEADKK